MLPSVEASGSRWLGARADAAYAHAMGLNAVPGFLPSRYGFHFRNSWPSNAARTLDLGFLHVPIGDTGRGLCGGMAFVARDLFERKEDAPIIDHPPTPDEPLFKEIVDRQFDSFGPFFSVPLRFWASSAGSQDNRTRETVRDAWPARGKSTPRCACWAPRGGRPS